MAREAGLHGRTGLALSAPRVPRARVLLAAACAACFGCGSEGALVGVIASDGGGAADSTVDGALDSAGEDGIGAGEAGGDGAFEAGDEGPLEEAGDGSLDAGGDGPLGPFSTPTVVDAIDDPGSNNTDPSMTSDARELYFVSDRSGNQDIWVSRRASAGDAWAAPDPVAELNTPMAEQAPAVSFDGLTLWFSRSVVARQPQIWVTTRSALGQTWSSPTPVTELNGAGIEISAKVDETSLLMFFESTRSGTSQLYASTRPNAQSPWGTPAPIQGLGPTGTAHDPFVASLGLRVWFESTQTGGGDLYAADRASVTDPFANVTPLSELDTPAQEADPWLSPDLHYILFASDRSGNMQIYQSSR